MLDILTNCEGSLRDTTSKKILVEITVLKMIEARNAVSIDTVLQQVQKLRSEGGSSSGGGTPAPRPQTAAPAPVRNPLAQATPSSPTPVKAAIATTVAPVSAVTAVSGDVEKMWTDLLSSFGRSNIMLSVTLQKAFPHQLKDKTFTIAFSAKDEEELAMFDSPKNRTIIAAKLAELGYADITVKFTKAEPPADRQTTVLPPAESEPAPVHPPISAPAEKPASVPTAKAAPPTPPAAPAKVSKDDFKNDPLIKKALEVFKGQIVDVRSSNLN
jgi:DNA polymerase-3 subunit gamma/tau